MCAYGWAAEDAGTCYPQPLAAETPEIQIEAYGGRKSRSSGYSPL